MKVSIVEIDERKKQITQYQWLMDNLKAEKYTVLLSNSSYGNHNMPKYGTMNNYTLRNRPKLDNLSILKYLSSLPTTSADGMILLRIRQYIASEELDINKGQYRIRFSFYSSKINSILSRLILHGLVWHLKDKNQHFL